MGGDSEAHDPALEEAIGSEGRSRPRKEFREACRAAFLAEGARHTGPSGEDQAEDSDPKRLSRHGSGSRTRDVVEEQMERILAGEPLPRARVAFREEQRALFLGKGLVAGRAGTVLPGPGARAEDDREEASAPVSVFRRVIVLTAAAAALLFVTFGMPKDQRWSVRDFRSGGAILAAGRAYRSEDGSQLGDVLSRGATLTTEDTTLDLGISDYLRVRVLGGTEVVLASLPEIGSDEPFVFSLDHGEIYVKTMEGYPGNPILIETPEQIVHVTGTVLGVMRNEDGTCCCVARGSVVVEDRVTGPADVRVGTCQSHLAFCDGRGGVVRDWGPEGSEGAPHTAPLLAFALQP